MRFRVAALACMAAVLLTVSSASGQTAALRYRWVKGDVVAYRVTQQNTSTMSGMPGMGDMVVEQSVEQGFRLTVEEVAADGTATLRQTFDSMRMTMNSPAGKIAFDSTSTAKTDDPMTAAVAAPMRAMIGESITLVMQPTGKIVKLEGMSRIFDKVMAGMSDPTAAQMLDQFKTSMGDEAMRMTFQQGFGSFPDHPVKIGETWTDKLETTHPLLGATTATATSTLKSIDAGTSLAHLAIKTAMTYASNGAPTGPMNMVVKATNSSGDGETLFDTTKGRVQKTTVRSEIPMTMSMQGPDGSPINIQSVNRTTMTVEVNDKK
jgi:uncharacterized protein DUF6263